jgi:heavy metal sensor kinase
MTLRTRLALWFSGVSLVLFVPLGGLLVWAHQRYTLAAIDAELTQRASTLESIFRGELAEDLTIAEALAHVEREVRYGGMVFAFLDDAGAVLAGGLRGAAPEGLMREAPAAAHVAWTVRGSPASRAHVATVSGVQPRLHILVTSPLEALANERAALIATMLALVPLVVIGAIAGATFVASRTLAPVSRMADEARALSPDAAAGRLTVPGTGDELDTVATTFNGLLDRLVAAMDRQRRFMADASHELRTPLSIVRSAAQVTLARPSRPESEYRDALRMAGDQAERMARIVDDLLLLARADAGGRPLVTELLDVDELARECARSASVIGEVRGVRVRVSAPPDLQLRGDAQLLRQMLMNLLTNAVRHTRDRTDVRLEVEAEAGGIVIRVSDHGTGVPPEAHNDIFERFVTLTGTPGEGAGLGLAIARWVAQAHGGTLRLAASSGEGSTFEVRLPAVA